MLPAWPHWLAEIPLWKKFPYIRILFMCLIFTVFIIFLLNMLFSIQSQINETSNFVWWGKSPNRNFPKLLGNNSDSNIFGTLLFKVLFWDYFLRRYFNFYQLSVYYEQKLPIFLSTCYLFILFHFHCNWLWSYNLLNPILF